MEFFPSPLGLCYLPAQRDKARYLLLVLRVDSAESASQVTLFQLNPDNYVAGCHRGKDQVPPRHDRSCPKRDHEAEHDRVAHVAIEGPGAERRRRVTPARRIEVYLPQSEKIEVIDEERGDQRNQPTDHKEYPHGGYGSRLLYVPDSFLHRAPLPEEESEQQAADQHVGASLDRWRHEPGPPALEAWPRHDAVWNRKQT